MVDAVGVVLYRAFSKLQEITFFLLPPELKFISLKFKFLKDRVTWPEALLSRHSLSHRNKKHYVQVSLEPKTDVLRLLSN